jgi:hypothetical protein
MTPYQAVFSRLALEFLIQADREETAEIRRWMERIERTPHIRGDFQDRDDQWRRLEVVALDHSVITYWVDDAVREVRICKIEGLRAP